MHKKIENYVKEIKRELRETLKHVSENEICFLEYQFIKKRSLEYYDHYEYKNGNTKIVLLIEKTEKTKNINFSRSQSIFEKEQYEEKELLKLLINNNTPYKDCKYLQKGDEIRGLDYPSQKIFKKITEEIAAHPYQRIYFEKNDKSCDKEACFNDPKILEGGISFIIINKDKIIKIPEIKNQHELIKILKNKNLKKDYIKKIENAQINKNGAHIITTFLFAGLLWAWAYDHCDKKIIIQAENNFHIPAIFIIMIFIALLIMIYTILYKTIKKWLARTAQHQEIFEKQ